MRLISFILGFVLMLQLANAQRPEIVRQVRAAIDAGQSADIDSLLAAHKTTAGADGAYLEALSWAGRGRFAAKDYVGAEKYAGLARAGVLALLKTRKLDIDSSLPLALGASIEVHSQVLNATGRKTEAVAFLQTEVKAWYGTGIRARIQKNLNLITLRGRRAPHLDTRQYLGAAPPSLLALRGKPVLLFFWAHWCGDCKAEASVLERLARENPDLAILGPTQHYGYVQGGEEASPEAELRYIEAVRARYYANIPRMTVPVSEENFKAWGASTTPTLALIDRLGIVRLYNPGRMTYEELAPQVAALLRPVPAKIPARR
jgi:thiol-disulfide isomerase/thioredoxin